jgi:hypothetical protein
MDHAEPALCSGEDAPLSFFRLRRERSQVEKPAFGRAYVMAADHCDTRISQAAAP